MNNLKTSKKIMPIALIALISVVIIGVFIFNTAHKDIAFASEATNASASSDANLGKTSQITVTCYQRVGNKNERPYEATFTWDAKQNGYNLVIKTRENADGGVDICEEFFNNIFKEVKKKDSTITKDSVVSLSLENGTYGGGGFDWYAKLWTHAGAINGWRNLKIFNPYRKNSDVTYCKFDTIDAFKNTEDAKPFGRSAENAVICNCPNLETVALEIKSTKDCINNSWNYLISNCPQCDRIFIGDHDYSFRPHVEFTNLNRVISGVKNNCYVKIAASIFYRSSHYNKAEDKWPY